MLKLRKNHLSLTEFIVEHFSIANTFEVVTASLIYVYL